MIVLVLKFTLARGNVPFGESLEKPKSATVTFSPGMKDRLGVALRVIVTTPD